MKHLLTETDKIKVTATIDANNQIIAISEHWKGRISIPPKICIDNGSALFALAYVVIAGRDMKS